VNSFNEARGRQLYTKCLRTVARNMEAAGETVDLPEAKRRVALGALYVLRDNIFEWFDAGTISGPQGDAMLAVVESKITEIENLVTLHALGLLGARTNGKRPLKSANPRRLKRRKPRLGGQGGEFGHLILFWRQFTTEKTSKNIYLTEFYASLSRLRSLDGQLLSVAT